MIHKGVANSVFEENLFTPIPHTVQVCYPAGLLKVRISMWIQNGIPPPPKPLQQP